MWGLTFKARTDDLRDSPSIAIIKRLLAAGATVQAFDPTVARSEAGDARRRRRSPPIRTRHATGADVLAVLTEWDDFRWLDAGKVADVDDRARPSSTPATCSTVASGGGPGSPTRASADS